MKAIVRHEYGPPSVLRLEEIPKPTPREDEVLIRVEAASVNLGDWELLTADPLYISVLSTWMGPKPRRPPASTARSERGSWRKRLWKPKYPMLGSDIAGRVEAVGRSVTRYQPGDEVFGDCGASGMGAFAEYVSVPEDAALAHKPESMTFVQAAAIPEAAFLAVQGLVREGRVRQGHEVLVNGAGGGAGTAAVQIAKAFGATVTGVDSGRKLELLRSLGADHVVDYTREDYTLSGRRYDIILDLAAYRSVFDSARALKDGGVYLMAGGSGKATFQSMALGPLISRLGRRRVAMLLAEPSSSDLGLMSQLFEQGKFVPIIDGEYPPEQAAAALSRLGDKLSLGKVVITMRDAP